MKKVAVIGAGSWGTTVAALIAPTTPTTLWARRPELAQSINQRGENPGYLPGTALPEDLKVTSDIVEAVSDADIVVMAVPSHGFRGVLTKIVPILGPDKPVLSLTKGIEQETLMTMTQVILDLLPDLDPGLIGVLAGPNLAAEIAAGQPAAAVVAMGDLETARKLQKIFMTPAFRVYTNNDVMGCELGGALKNVMAIAAGMSDGLGFGNNTRATLVTRALAELTRLGVKLGGRPPTFSGLAGVGDLIATCVSSMSRNHRVGVLLAQGKNLETVLGEMKMVAEGVKTTKAAIDLADRHQVEMPIANHVGLVLYEGLHPRDAVLRLMTRDPKAEH